MTERECFVTVGTTSFDALVAIVSSSREVHEALRSIGITRLKVQIGRGTVEPPSDDKTGWQTSGEQAMDIHDKEGADSVAAAAAANVGKAAVGLPGQQDGQFLPLEWFRFAPTLEEHMRSAALVVSHGGAGSIMEALALGKPLVVVANDALMDNHQEELAAALASRGHLAMSATCGDLAATLRSIVSLQGEGGAGVGKKENAKEKRGGFVPYPKPDGAAFPKLVDATCGF